MVARADRFEGQTPPGPGVPVTIVDSGLDLTHPEFAGASRHRPLNAQEPAPLGGEHGTSVASVIGAPLNGVGLVGIYPQAVLRSWDAAMGCGTRLESSEIAGGILAAARAGKSVINLSLGGRHRDLSIELAVSEAVATGSLVVAASGNDGDRGSPLGYPAALPHVTTVGATDRSGAIAAFSSRSPYVDLVAPGGRHRRRERARQELAPARPARASRPRSSPELRPGSGLFVPSSTLARSPSCSALCARPRGTRTRHGGGLRDAQRRRRPRARHADPRPASSRTTTSTRSIPTATGTSRRPRR